MKARTISILLVEDDDVDARFVERAFRKHQVDNPIHRVPDGIAALAKLRGEGTEPLARPYLVLLDLRTPRMDGIEFLEELRRDPDVRDSVVFVLTTSNDERDKVAAYDKCIAGYMVKSRLGSGFRALIALLVRYSSAIEFPPSRG